MVECAGKGMGTPCSEGGTPTRRCGACGAVGYCSASHQRAHWSHHKRECARFQLQMTRAEALEDFPFTFSDEIKRTNKCAFLMSRGLHGIGMWKFECFCTQFIRRFESRMVDSWDLLCSLCPCNEPRTPLLLFLRSWKDYYEWRQLPFCSPVALLLHWPLTLYHCIQLSSIKSSSFQDRLIIHYLGPDKEITQLSAFGELRALFPDLTVLVEFFGPDIPDSKDGVRIELDSLPHCEDMACSCKSSAENSNLGSFNSKCFGVTLQFNKGLYHERYRDRGEPGSPHIIVAPNAGVAAYPSWLPTIELIKEMSVPAFFSDYCEEAAELASQCITSVTGQPLGVPVQINPFRQPAPVEDTALYLPCYSNCFIFGM